MVSDNKSTVQRGSGVLMHVSSLYGKYSVGSFGTEAKEFVDFLESAGFSYWQVLPFCMTDECNSPYKSFSAFAGNPFFIDLVKLRDLELLTQNELDGAAQETPWLCEFARLRKERIPLLRKAAARAYDDNDFTKNIEKFIKNHKDLYDACVFLALKDKNGGASWDKWETEKYDENDLKFWEFVQYEFFTQWAEIRTYANEKGIKIIGDIPFYVDYDSCDVWANKKYFQLDKDGKPTGVAGVPPDYFSEDGQMWNNPLYNWKEMKKDSFGWWARRMQCMFELFDGVRIDHFRALESYWSIPVGAETAKEGKWVKGPGKPFIDMLNSVKGDGFIIAEDLGDITEEVNKLVKYSGFPGMRVFQFGFLGDPDSTHLPHNYPANCVAYTGTHDNNTLLGAMSEFDEGTVLRVFDYCNLTGTDLRSACGGIIKIMLESHADTVIFPIQDLLRYGDDTRMNKPGTGSGNWAYRVKKEQLSDIDTFRLAYLNGLYARR